MATALLVAGSTLTFWISPFASTSSYSSAVKALGCLCNCRRLVCSSFQLTHMSCDDHTVQLIEPWRPRQRQNVNTALTMLPQGEFRHVSISARQQSLQCGQNFRGPFLRATLPMTVELCARAMADTGRQKGS